MVDAFIFLYLFITSDAFLFAFKAACVPSIMSGNDVVIAAETGSGKTHGYLVPLINKICNEQRDDKLTDGDQDLASINKLSLVLCPNVMLCEQVVQMANTLCDEHGKSLLRVTTVCGRQVKKSCPR